jgi:hypothetical protein
MIVIDFFGRSPNSACNAYPRHPPAAARYGEETRFASWVRLLAALRERAIRRS